MYTTNNYYPHLTLWVTPSGSSFHHGLTLPVDVRPPIATVGEIVRSAGDKQQRPKVKLWSRYYEEFMANDCLRLLNRCNTIWLEELSIGFTTKIQIVEIHHAIRHDTIDATNTASTDMTKVDVWTEKSIPTKISDLSTLRSLNIVQPSDHQESTENRSYDVLKIQKTIIIPST